MELLFWLHLSSLRHSMECLAILPSMENVSDEQGIRRDLIANFIVVHDETPDLTGSENREQNPHTRKLDQNVWRCRQTPLPRAAAA